MYYLLCNKCHLQALNIWKSTHVYYLRWASQSASCYVWQREHSRPLCRSLNGNVTLSPKITPYQGHWWTAELEHKPWCSDSESDSLLTWSYCLLYPLFSLPVLHTSGWIFWGLFLTVFAMTLCISQGSFNFKWQKFYSKKIYWFMYRGGWGVSGVRHCRVWGLTDSVRVFSPLHFLALPLSGFWPHPLPADVSFLW